LLSVGPGQQLIDIAVWMTVHDPDEDDVGKVFQRIDVVDLAGLCGPPNYAESGRFPQIFR
jgi:hypothetical protein